MSVFFPHENQNVPICKVLKLKNRDNIPNKIGTVDR